MISQTLRSSDAANRGMPSGSNPAFRTPTTVNVLPKGDGTSRQALESTAAPIVDDRTDKSTPVKTNGGGTQWTITPTDRADLVATNPGYR